MHIYTICKLYKYRERYHDSLARQRWNPCWSPWRPQGFGVFQGEVLLMDQKSGVYQVEAGSSYMFIPLFTAWVSKKDIRIKKWIFLGSKKNIPKPCKNAGQRPLQPRKRRKEETKKERNKETRKNAETRQRRNEATKKRGKKETRKRRNDKTKKQRNEETKKWGNKERKKQRNEGNEKRRHEEMRKRRNEGSEETKKRRNEANEETPRSEETKKRRNDTQREHICSPLRSTLNTNGITGLDMCKIWTNKGGC